MVPCLLSLLFGGFANAQVQGGAKPAAVLPPVTVTAAANRDPVEKSYRRMLRGIELFDQERADRAPDAVLRFKLLPRRRDTDMANVGIDVIGSTMSFPVAVAADRTFTLPRNAQAYDEDAQVTTDKKVRSLTWRADVRSPGVAPGTRRLGDLRLECRVGMQAGLVSGNPALVFRIASAVLDSPSFCDSMAPRYLFFSEHPLFGVTLVHGARRHVVPMGRLYEGAVDEPLGADRSDCDCELLLDRTYFLPLGDRSWPDDTLVEFEPMEGDRG